MTMIELIRTNLYKKGLKLIFKRGKSPKKMFNVINLLLDNANKGMEHHLLL